MNSIIGTIEVTRSFVYKITGDAQPHSGMGKFENKEWFASRKATALSKHSEEVGEYLYAICEREVLEAAERHANWTLQPAPPPTNVSIETPAPSDRQPEHQPAPPSYVVAEKVSPVAALEPPVTVKSTPEWKTLAERLKVKGLTSEELTTACCLQHNKSKGSTFTGAEKLATCTHIEAYLETHTIEHYRAQLANPAQVPQQTATDPAVAEATKQVAARWPLWSPELVKIAALWCADQVKGADILDACLIAAGVTQTTPPGKIESLLAISRHMAMGAMLAIATYAKKSNDPIGLIEEQLSKAAGKPIRFAMDLPANAVAEAFQALVEAQKQKGAAK